MQFSSFTFPLLLFALTKENNVFAAPVCEDSTEHFVASGLFKNVNKKTSCAGAAKYPKKLCQFPEVKSNCPETCETCYNGKICTDSNVRFYIPDSNGPTQSKKCIWAARKKTDKRCQLENVAEMCPVTCGKCDPDYQPYSFDSTNKAWSRTRDSWPYGTLFDDGNYLMMALRMIGGWISPPMLDVNLDSNAVLKLSFDFQISDSSNDPCPNTELYARLRLRTGPYDLLSSAATTELVGPMTKSESSYSQLFDISHDIVSKAQEGYAYNVDIVTPGVEGEPPCIGTYNGLGFSVMTNFAYYNWQEPTQAPVKR